MLTFYDKVDNPETSSGRLVLRMQKTVNKGSKAVYTVTQPIGKKRKRGGNGKEAVEQPSKMLKTNGHANSKFQASNSIGKLSKT